MVRGPAMTGVHRQLQTLLLIARWDEGEEREVVSDIH